MLSMVPRNFLKRKTTRILRESTTFFPSSRDSNNSFLLETIIKRTEKIGRAACRLSSECRSLIPSCIVLVLVYVNLWENRSKIMSLKEHTQSRNQRTRKKQTEGSRIEGNLRESDRETTSLSVVLVMRSIMCRTRWLCKRRSRSFAGSRWSSRTMSRSSHFTSSWPKRVTPR